MLLTVLDLLMTAYEGVLIIYMMKKQFVQTKHSVLIDLAGVSGIFFYITLIQYLHIPIPDSLVFIIPFVYIKFTTDEPLSTCLLWTILDGFIFSGTAILVSYFFEMQCGINGETLVASEETQIIAYFIGNSALTVTCSIAAHLGRKAYYITLRETVIIILVLAFTFIINECCFLARVLKQGAGALLVCTICSFAVMVLTIVLYELLIESTRKRREIEMEAQTTRLVTEHQEELNNIYQNMLSEQHDLRHRISAIEAILSSATISEQDRQTTVHLLNQSLHPDLFFTGSVAVDALLKAKTAIMEKAGIFFDFDEYPLQPLPIPENELCMLLGNMLDNAIDGVASLPTEYSSRHIFLRFSKVWGMLFITCTNDADTSRIKRQGEEFITLKEHPELHGFGTKNMKKIVENAGGTIEYEIVPGKFTVHIILGGSSSR